MNLMTPITLKDRCIGAIAGFAIGDALGMPADFLSREQIKRYYGKPISDFIKAHPGHANDSLPPGSYTDNTRIMLAVAECLIECKKMDPAKQADALLSWYLNTVPHRTPSKSNLQACKHLSTGRPWNKSGVYSSGNASAMRMSPLGIFLHRSPDNLTRAALDNCIITHTEPRARAASVSVAYLTARLLQSHERCWPGDQVLETADRIAYLDEDFAAVLRWTTQITHLPPEEALFEIGTSSDAIETVPAAIYCFLKYPRDFTSAVLSAVNAGESASSIGALAGCFVGLTSGFTAINQKWMESVENPDILVGVGENLAKMIDRPRIEAAGETSSSIFHDD
jgi:ADP-ribosyl-[dinitrogen reductase] hydrolase